MVQLSGQHLYLVVAGELPLSEETVDLLDPCFYLPFWETYCFVQAIPDEPDEFLLLPKRRVLGLVGLDAKLVQTVDHLTHGCG